MPDQRRDRGVAISQQLLEFDIAQLDHADFNTPREFDDIASILALEHFGRFEALLRCVRDETMARNLFVMMSQRALSEAQDIQGRINAPSRP